MEHLIVLGRHNAWCLTYILCLRHHDVIIANSSMAVDEDGVDVQLYIRDRFDHHEAALEKWQLAAVFDRCTDSIEDSFGYRVTGLLEHHLYTGILLSLCVLSDKYPTRVHYKGMWYVSQTCDKEVVTEISGTCALSLTNLFVESLQTRLKSIIYTCW